MWLLIQSAAMKSISHASNNDAARPKSRRRAFVISSWVAVIAMAALIFWMSAKDGTTLDEDSGIISIVKAWLATAAQAVFGHPVDVSPIGHFTEYLIFGALFANALRWHMPARKATLTAVVLASAYGVTDEIHQIFVPMRSCDPMDWAVDTAAAAVGAFIVFACLRKSRRNQTKR